MKYRGQYNIKDLRSDSGALGWAHATESAGQYLQDIIPSVCEAKIRGTYRHTSSEDKTDPKKVVTTSFYDHRGRKIATCHAHGDGTWSIAFQKDGQAELRKRDASAPAVGDHDDRPELNVAVVESVSSAGLVIHHGEMIHKPRACRGAVAENNDEVHRAHRASDYAADRCVPPRQASVMPAHSMHRGAEAQGSTAFLPNANRDSTTGGSKRKKSASEMERLPRAEPLPRLPSGGGAHLLDAEQQDLAAELARMDLRAREQRMLFSRLKALPWEQQERTLERSKALKTKTFAAVTNTG
ncbi:hypothetical protein F4775DRAFT_565837 [Biscogniauxia sp. FL1348]|nr:hypothetical protein F4775DRAFT_565837 [Biscogniauxia sp. FL1348]